MIDNRMEKLRRRAEKLIANETMVAEGMELLALVHEMELHGLDLATQCEEFRDAQAQAIDLRERYQELFDFAPFGYFRIDPNGIILEANRKAAELTGFAPHLLRNKNFARHLTATSSEAFDMVVKEAVSSNTRQNCSIQLRQGKNLRQVEVAIEPGSPNTTGNRELNLGVVDVTERWEAEKALRASHVDLEKRVTERTSALAETITALQGEIVRREGIQENLRGEMEERLKTAAALREKDRLLTLQSRHAAMGEMVGNIAHQWRQPLNIVGMHLQRLLVFDDAGCLDRQMLETTVEEGMTLIYHMSKTIDDFRNFFRPDRDKVSFAVAEAVHLALSLVRETYRHNDIAIDSHLEGDGVITGYPNEFSQALLNLLQNAKDALLERQVADPKVVIASKTDGDGVVITVTDNAGGIDTDIIGMVFDPYFSTKGVQGTGIGLYMSKTIVEKNMGGQLVVRNVTGGAEFSIRIPAAAPPAAS